MLDIGWSELLVIGVVALIVVGPKDLPGMFRTLGQFTGKIRRMGRDFQRAMDEAAKDSGIHDTAASLKSATSSRNLGLDTLKNAADKFDKWQPPSPTRPAPQETEEARAARTAETKRILEKAKADREARAAATKAQTTPPPQPPAASPAPSLEPYRARPKPGTPVARGARPKNMPKKGKRRT